MKGLIFDYTDFANRKRLIEFKNPLIRPNLIIRD